MDKMKRSLSMLLVGILAFGAVLSGCGSSEPGDDTKAVSQQSQAAANTAEQPESQQLDEVNIAWYFVGPGEQKDTAKVEEEASKYLKDKINVNLKLNCLDWGTYQQKMNAMIAAGEPFDLCFTASWMLDYNKNARTGAFIPINDLMDKYAPKTKDLLGADFLKASQIEGKNYALPCNKEKARSYGIVYNKATAEKYGFDMSTVKSIKDLEPMLKKIKESEPSAFPFIGGSLAFGIYDWHASNSNESPDVGDINAEGKVINQFETPEFKEMWQLMNKYYKAGYIRKDIITQQNVVEEAVSSGQAFAWCVNLKPGYAEEYTANKQLKEKHGFELGQIDFTEPVMCTADVMGSMTAISKTSSNPERAMMFLELFNTDKYLNNLINFGIENTHYKKINDNTIETIPDSGYALGMQWALGNQFINYLQKNENPNKWTQFEEFNKAAKPSPEVGFLFNPESVKTEKAACDTIIGQYARALDNGVIDPDKYLPEFLSKLKAAGADKIIAEKQKQFDQWKATK
ncbi:ABC transporter substrate-binding protein [Ruminiclostridium cellobioparum]|jgi:putative aldouronate transport system substrate-binding protein|uniref:ABC transporter substrate-binding protein n=1 Tax=Ruminiclostridium cellobioparum TaxID=29355 RepID=UPI0028AED158|nr:ABC transporter substrate-binding protein [Ruminiclostridium cellobioparum]